ncbi:Aste57867_22746 [Aphanomyces stellatus]|uniref:Aste57867_22746 protein n=1 Tax=Aphanomyces stellatus TaxID=120398 RepID=A0A485LQM9_9STRA|nr:hypothetical protein As57867_022676 [Aphanomyces stellatus]VFT99399.1 Aste57867_22746 [Aphanomyces stellatus]
MLPARMIAHSPPSIEKITSSLDHDAISSIRQQLVGDVQAGNAIDVSAWSDRDVARILDHRFKEGITFLHLAAWEGHVQATRVFLRFLDVDVPLAVRWSIVVDHAHKLVKNDANPDLVGMSPLQFACQAGALDVVHDSTPLFFACEQNYIEIVRVLFDAGADVNLTPERSVSPLTLAASFGNIEIVRLLLPHVDATHAGEVGLVGLAIAYRSFIRDICQYLIDTHAVGVNVMTETGATPLHIACLNGRVPVVQYLLPLANVNATDAFGATPLHIASKVGNVEIVRLLVDVADVNKPDNKGQTPLHIAATYGFAHVVAVLATTCSTSLRDHAGQTAGDVAKLNKNTDVDVVLTECVAAEAAVAQIKASRCNWNHRFENSMTALILAARCGRIDLAKLALDGGCDINLFDTQENTALSWATRHGHLKMVQYLSKQPSCDVHIACWRPDGLGRSRPVFTALDNSHFDIACVLIAHHSSFYIQSHGRLLLDMLAPYVTEEVATLLLLRDMPIKIVDGAVLERIGHSFSWATFLDPSLPVDPKVRVSTVRVILQHPTWRTAKNSMDVYKALTYATDKYGRIALHSTDAATRQVLTELLFFCGRYEIFDGAPLHVSATSIVVHAFDHGMFTQVFEMHANENGELDVRGFIQCSQTLNLDYQGVIETPQRRTEFDIIDRCKRGTITKTDYLRFCNQKYGGKMKVALKFMRNEDEYVREQTTRQGLHSKFVLNILPSASLNAIQQNIKTLTLYGDIPGAKYPHMLVLPFADRSLQDIYDKEYVSENKIRQIMEEIARCLQHIHSRGIVHGDLKKLNIFRAANRLQLADMDAATVGPGQLAGAKWSSGILPPGTSMHSFISRNEYNFFPEMFCQLNKLELAAYTEYWHGVDSQLWSKVKPRGNSYVVKCFRTDKASDELLNPLVPPYELQETSPAIDLWAFGCLMFQMYSGEELVPTDRNQDATDQSIEWAATLSDEALRRVIRSKIRHDDAGDLIEKLLVVDPTQRLRVEDIVMHPYFTARHESPAPQNRDTGPTGTSGQAKAGAMAGLQDQRANTMFDQPIEKSTTERPTTSSMQDPQLANEATKRALDDDEDDATLLRHVPDEATKDTLSSRLLVAVASGQVADAMQLARHVDLKCAVDADGNGPLHVASANGQPELVAMLARRCDRSQQNKHGLTALDIASMKYAAALGVLHQLLLVDNPYALLELRNPMK